jgi:hypothetical protein
MVLPAMTLGKNFASPFLLVISTLLIGCVTSNRPTGSADFGSITSLNQLEGIYRNQGETGEGGEGGTRYIYYLSAILWPNEKLDHAVIEIMEVRAVDEKRLVVKAYTGTKLMREEIYMEGKDFTIDSGRIVVKRKLGLATQNAAGPVYESAELGLDLKGHGKYKRTTAFAGIVLLIPLAMSETDEVRFIRIAK